MTDYQRGRVVPSLEAEQLHEQRATPAPRKSATPRKTAAKRAPSRKSSAPRKRAAKGR